MTMTEKTKEIRKQLKEKLNLNSRQVSVTTKHYSSINIKIKSVEGLKHQEQIEEIANQFEKIDYCEYTQEILAGGNTFVFVDIDYDFFANLKEEKKELLENTIGNAKRNPNKTITFKNLSFNYFADYNEFFIHEDVHGTKIFEGDLIIKLLLAA